MDTNGTAITSSECTAMGHSLKSVGPYSFTVNGTAFC